ncbi:S-formylglutathione hydrolase [Caballeronia udeis]|uniref:S-formylglutathione hydrolase n=1 Tax=Caballeronia udeis TaxID=1232866 RepID=A0ABW8MWK5_9BURK
MERIEHRACFDGWQDVYRRESPSRDCSMNFPVFFPALSGKKLPVLYPLAGLTCTEQNFSTKTKAQQYATRHGVIIVAPDTSPRGEQVADDMGNDLGKGAGFYVNATQKPWAAHYRMYDYVVTELSELLESEFLASEVRSISGHSMGGHGALVPQCNPGRYSSVSAFSPIVAPSRVPWGEKALEAYLGPDRTTWRHMTRATSSGPRQGSFRYWLIKALRTNFLRLTSNLICYKVPVKPSVIPDT